MQVLAGMAHQVRRAPVHWGMRETNAGGKHYCASLTAGLTSWLYCGSAGTVKWPGSCQWSKAFACILAKLEEELIAILLQEVAEQGPGQLCGCLQDRPTL